MPESYDGPLEFAGGRVAWVTIDDLDSSGWRATPLAVLRAMAPDPWFVGVHLLKGERAGQYATADLHQRPATLFVGREPFRLAPPGAQARHLSLSDDVVRALKRGETLAWSAALETLPELIRVYPVASPIEVASQNKAILCSVEVWADRLILRTASASRPVFGAPTMRPIRQHFEIRDDIGTTYRDHGSGSGTGGGFTVGHATFVPSPPAKARHLHISSDLIGADPIDIELQPNPS